MRYRLACALVVLALSAPMSAQFDNVGTISFPTSGSPQAQRALPARRGHPAQLRLEAGDRRVQARPAGAARLRDGVLGRDALLQPSADAPSRMGRTRERCWRAWDRTPRRASPKRRRRAKRASSRRSRSSGAKANGGSAGRLHERDGAALQTISRTTTRSRRSMPCPCSAAPARWTTTPSATRSRPARWRWTSSTGTPSIRARRTTRSTRSTIPSMRHSRSTPRKPTRRSSRRSRTASTCRRISSSSTACGTRCRARTCAPSRWRRICWQPGDVPGDMVHSLDWGQYGFLQLGDYAAARKAIELFDQMVETTKHQRARGAAALTKARYIIETEEWKVQPVAEGASNETLLANGHERGEDGRPGHGGEDGGAAGREGAGGAGRSRGGRRTRGARPAPARGNARRGDDGKAVRVMHRELSAPHRRMRRARRIRRSRC